MQFSTLLTLTTFSATALAYAYPEASYEQDLWARNWLKNDVHTVHQDIDSFEQKHPGLGKKVGTIAAEAGVTAVAAAGVAAAAPVVVASLGTVGAAALTGTATYEIGTNGRKVADWAVNKISKKVQQQKRALMRRALLKRAVEKREAEVEAAYWRRDPELYW